ncbi:hypothetical protein PISMIDRAFT_685948 [Pisolithus microcarpus 441]|uniref:Uncharacterized protein n=1 Tax=Pisolithus microcarpus 441 TaxID=765257 RepID=A0A0C9XWJ8_9AGAM|nr:hypothetical protein PISMIDRAFT_685948 [Pisolithus microcarpus 441]
MATTASSCVEREKRSVKRSRSGRNKVCEIRFHTRKSSPSGKRRFKGQAASGGRPDTAPSNVQDITFLEYEQRSIEGGIVQGPLDRSQ